MGRSALLRHAGLVVGHGRRRSERWVKGCSCLGAPLKGLRGVVGRRTETEMGSAVFRWRRRRVGIVDRVWGGQGRG